MKSHIRRAILPIVAFACLLGWQSGAYAQGANIEERLTNAPVQEKAYLHLDNNCYFLGDTIWYKAYLVEAGNLRPTAESRILYVELVDPEGHVVERHRQYIGRPDADHGDFALADTLHSGYYELRAYTRWMMNFCVTERPYNRKDRELFYNRQMAKDFFRDYGTVWSRVVAVYERPEKDGDYSDRQILPRPRQRAIKPKKPSLNVTFYPEGGNLIAGTRCRIAFEVLNEDGEAVNITGKVDGQDIRADFMGRGSFFYEVPKKGKARATFSYQGEDYRFVLPDILPKGLTLRICEDEVTLQGRGLSAKRLKAAFLTRGVLRSLLDVSLDAKGEGTLHFDRSQLPTGVCDLVVYDEKGNVLADRLFFVNSHDYDQRRITIEGTKSQYQPYEKADLTLKAPRDVRTLSVAIRDQRGVDASYDSGTLLTDLLLTSDIQGFVARPDYYFERDDSLHRARLDVLLMVQGWRRYDFKEMTDGKPLRYHPEKNIEIDGTVYKAPVVDPIEPAELSLWRDGVFGWTFDEIANTANLPAFKSWLVTGKIVGEQGALAEKERGVLLPQAKLEDQTDNQTQEDTQDNTTGEGTNSDVERDNGFNHPGLKHEVTVEGEMTLTGPKGEKSTPFTQQTTDGGRFHFQMAPFWGEGRLLLSAHKQDISTEEWHANHTKDIFDEEAWPDYYVKLDMFYPVFARKYSWYETHHPATSQQAGTTTRPETTTNDMSITLPQVSVKGRRRHSKQAIAWDKPVCQYDAEQLYNLATDYGLSFGKVNFRRLPYQLSVLLFGNYGTTWTFNVEGHLDGVLFYRSFDTGRTKMMEAPMNRSNYSIYKDLFLRRQQTVKFYTDFDLRNSDRYMEMSSQTADVTLDFETIPNDGTRYTMRDRSLILPGITEPDEYYHPDYSHRQLPRHADYRRTLYWNPSLRVGATSKAHATFYNNSQKTCIQVSAMGMGNLGPASN